MAAVFYEDVLEFEIEVAKPLPMGAEVPFENLSSYPYAQLRPTGKVVKQAFKTLVLENPYLKLLVLPDLGGRIISLFDKRTQREILLQAFPLRCCSEGHRGAWFREGIQWMVGREDRPNAMEDVKYHFREPESEALSVVLLMHKLMEGDGLSWHASIGLPSDRAEVQVHFKVLNRTFLPQAYQSGFRAFLGDSGVLSEPGDGSFAFYSSERGTGLGVFFDKGDFESACFSSGELKFYSVGDKGHFLGPRQVDSWSVQLVPFSGLGGLTAFSKDVGMYLEAQAQRLFIQSTKPWPQQKVLLLTQEGQTLETSVDLYPERVLELDLGGLETLPKAFVIRDPLSRKDLLQHEVAKDGVVYEDAFCFGRSWLSVQQEALVGMARETFWENYFEKPQASGVATREAAYFAGLHKLYWGVDPTEELRASLHVDGLRSASLSLLALVSLHTRQYSEAAHLFEEALLFNGEDYLNWCLKAIAMRLEGMDAEESPELLNAHYLAPLEPLLRAESFLRQPQLLTKEGSPFLDVWDSNPEAFIEVACILLEAGLYDEATRWMDEALRHVNVPMLHYLQAWCYLRGSRMTVQAAEHVSRVAQRPLEPPYPWRPLEFLVIRELEKHFPKDESLQELRKLIDRISSGQRSVHGARDERLRELLEGS